MTDNVPDLIAAETAARVAAIDRQRKSADRKEKIAAINDYTALFATQLLGIAGIAGGVLVLIKPAILPITQNQGLYALIVGITLLTGKKVLAEFGKLNS